MLTLLRNMEVEMKEKIEIVKKFIKKSKIYKPIMRNFKLPVMVVFLVLGSYSYRMFYSSRFLSDFQKYLVPFFIVSLVICTLVTIKVVLDIFSIIFFQKGQDSLKSKAKK